MQYSAKLFIRLQNFNGDASGGLYGNFAIFGSADSTAQLGNFSVQAKAQDGVDSIATLHAALAAKQGMPALTSASDPQAPTTATSMPPTPI